MWGEEWSARCRTQTNEEKDEICSSPRSILLKSEMVGDVSALIKQGFINCYYIPQEKSKDLVKISRRLVKKNLDLFSTRRREIFIPYFTYKI
jgi:hypothetical protein